MSTILPRPPKVEIDFTDAQLTGFGGWSVLGQMAERLGLPRALSAVSVKQRARGASDAETLWSLIASLAAGNGALSDLDALREDRVGQRLLGLRQVPSGRRLVEYLARIDEAQVETLLAVARGLAGHVAPAVVEHEVTVRGYVPVFVDGTAIEVDGRLFEEARRGYDSTRQYWLHGVFIGSLWASGRLHPGGVDVAGGWRDDLPLDELVRRHRGKQGQENAFKGPRPAARPAAPDPLSGAGRRQAGAQRPALAARLRAQQLASRLALPRRRPTRIAGPGVDPSIPGSPGTGAGTPRAGTVIRAHRVSRPLPTAGANHRSRYDRATHP